MATAEQQRARSRALVARGLCRRAAAHGPATRGKLCEACAEGMRHRNLRPALMSRAETKAFWAGMREWYAMGGRRMLR
jgi:hypothetical protein